MKLSKLKLFLTDKDARFSMLGSIGCYKNYSDEEFLKKVYKGRMGKALNLIHPVAFSEKLQWLKLYDRKPIYTMMVDKYEVKEYVANKIGKEYIIPTYGVWDNFNDINFDTLPDQFVIKCTHDSGGVVICKDKNSFDLIKAKWKIENGLKKNYYWRRREWPYKNARPRIMIEKYMAGEGECELFTNEMQKVIDIDFDSFSNYMQDIYIEDWEIIKREIKSIANSEIILTESEFLEEKHKIYEKITESKSFVKGNFYCIDKRLYFLELIVKYENVSNTPPQSGEYDLESCIKLSSGERYLLKAGNVCLLINKERQKSLDGLDDYKIWCFNGEPKYIQYITGRNHKETYEAFYNTDWEKQPFYFHNLPSTKPIEKPQCFEELLSVAKILAKDLIFVRLDFYVLSDGSIRFGEITFYPMSGMSKFHPEEIDYEFGELLKIPTDYVDKG